MRYVSRNKDFLLNISGLSFGSLRIWMMSRSGMLIFTYWNFRESFQLTMKPSESSGYGTFNLGTSSSAWEWDDNKDCWYEVGKTKGGDNNKACRIIGVGLEGHEYIVICLPSLNTCRTLHWWWNRVKWVRTEICQMLVRKGARVLLTQLCGKLPNLQSMLLTY